MVRGTTDDVPSGGLDVDTVAHVPVKLSVVKTEDFGLLADTWWPLECSVRNGVALDVHSEDGDRCWAFAGEASSAIGRVEEELCSWVSTEKATCLVVNGWRGWGGGRTV